MAMVMTNLKVSQDKVQLKMDEGELVEAAKLADSIDNSEFETLQNEFESLGTEEHEPRVNTKNQKGAKNGFQQSKGSRTGSIEEAENKNPPHCHYGLCQ